jgi:hypothetical protein
VEVCRRWGRLLLAAVALQLTLGSGLQAQQLDHGRDGVKLEGFGGIYLPGKIDFQEGETTFQVDESRWIAGGRLAYTFGFNLFLEASLAYTPLRMTMADSSVMNLDTFIGTGVIGYNLQLMPTAQLFVLAGGGVTQSVPKGLAAERQL